jgi:hypothetical protein
MTKRTANWRNFLEMTTFNGSNHPSCRRFGGMVWHQESLRVRSGGRGRLGSQLSKYAGLADQLEQHITDAKNKPQKPKLFGNLEFGNDTQEAFNAFEAEHKLMQMEAEIKHEFLYGAFADLEGGYGSLDGYRKFLEMRRKIRADRIRMKQEQQMMQKKFWDDLFIYGGVSAVVVVGCVVLYMAIDFIFRYAK